MIALHGDGAKVEGDVDPVLPEVLGACEEPLLGVERAQRRLLVGRGVAPGELVLKAQVVVAAWGGRGGEGRLVQRDRAVVLALP